MQYEGFENEFHSGNIHLYCGDCMDLMRQTPDKHFSLACVDPPYGLDKRLSSGGGQHKFSKFRLQYVGKEWDEVPTDEFFGELFRISENEIICGANYFRLPPTRGIVCWDKLQMMQTFSRWEYLWTSYDAPARTYEERSTDPDRIHPTQKPVALYKWLLKNYAKTGDTILDTHGGSFSSAIACHQMGFDFVGVEKDEEYFNTAVKRFKQYQSQGVLF